ncbi:MAG: hypothetical protein Q9217_004249 [Psora testacea]
MDALSSHRFQAAADSPSGIVFKPDIFNCDIRTSNTPIEKETGSRSSSITKERRREGVNGQALDAAKAKNKSSEAGTGKGDRHVTFQDSQVKRRLSSIHPAFRQRPNSGRANDIATIDDRIARNGGTTSSYKQLPHRLRISKQRHPISSAERVMELTRTNGYLLQELAYYKDIQVADMKFYVTVMDLHAKLGDALKERSQKRADAESTLLSYWGIDFGDGNVEDAIF